MAWSESERGLCRKHPEVKQFPGAVCPACLSEKLSQLYAPSSISNTKLTADFLGYGFLPVHSCSSSDYSSASSSPPLVINPGRKGHHQRNESEVMGRSISFMFSSEATKQGGGHGLMKKSRSVAGVKKSGGSLGFGDQGVIKSGKKKRGFWSKLIRGTGRKTKQVLKHPKSALRSSRGTTTTTLVE